MSKQKKIRERESDIVVASFEFGGFLLSSPWNSRQFVDPNHSLSLALHVHSLSFKSIYLPSLPLQVSQDIIFLPESLKLKTIVVKEAGAGSKASTLTVVS